MIRNISCRAAAFIIKDGKLLFAKNVNHPSYYIVGGCIEESETSEEAICRELFEETGLKLEVDKLVIVQERFTTNEVNKQRHHEIVFFYTIKNCDNIHILDGSFSDQGTKEIFHWLPIKDLAQFNIVPEFLKTKSFENMAKIEHIIIRE